MKRKAKLKLIAWLIALFSFPVLAHSAGVTVTSPSAGDTWYIGGTYTITWTTSIPADKEMAIKLLDEHGNFLFNIAKPTDNDGHEDWTIPSSVSPGNYIIRVKRKGGSKYGDSGVFTIASPRIDVTKPSSGDTWEKGTSFNIRWDNYGNPGSRVNIALYTTGGIKVKDLATNVSNSCSHCSYNCPASAINSVTPGNYKVTIETTDHAFSDESDVFSITEASGGSEGGEGSEGESEGGSGGGPLSWLDPHKLQKVDLRVPESIRKGIKVPPHPEPDPWWRVNLGELLNSLKQRRVSTPLIVELAKGGEVVAKLVRYNANGTVRAFGNVQFSGGLAKFKLSKNKAREVAKTRGSYKLILKNAKTGEILKAIPIRTAGRATGKRPIMMRKPMVH